ncbi:hypothetical protein [Prosthecobacter vanneervenii]|uniref:Uncharacterized protein n=1 Tax=Prosthecobacter vanneervenii TaxID=48466 RepID=A0A7W7Y9Z5_9BACT|nr:hypothetical protein [Prosthecobacter vanneervenii]MBB5032157.1 hypothetical protein [Prosthecobacter vanneervenii]
MKLLFKVFAAAVLLALGYWLYGTAFQKYQIRSKVFAAREMIVTGKFDERSLYKYTDEIANSIGHAITPSVRKDLENYAESFARSGDPELFAAGVLLDRPYWKWANGIGLKYTLPACMALLENLDRYPPESRTALEGIICHILPKASKQSFGMTEEKFTQDPEQRKVAIVQWKEWYKQNKDRVLAKDEKHMQAVEEELLEMKREMLRVKTASDDFDIEIKPKADK